MSYGSQGKRLREVQKRSRELEESVFRTIASLTTAKGGRASKVRYSDLHKLATVQVDVVVPNTEQPDTLFFVTYTDPDNPGHSNENKLHLKLGELYLFKTYNPKLRCVLVVAESEHAWLAYVLRAFELFFDRIVYTWQGDLRQKLDESLSSVHRNERLWNDEARRVRSIPYTSDLEVASNSSLRADFYRKVVPNELGVKDPSAVGHPILAAMARDAKATFEKTGGKQGMFWQHLSRSNYDAIWEERTYFNPMEYTVSYLLKRAMFRFKPQFPVPYVLQQFGMSESYAKEDFALKAADDKDVFIQCKASGGGMAQHGKAVMNRSKEQVARSLLYRSSREGDELRSGTKSFYWISVIDGKWRIPRRYPLKYVHMLQMAGYDRIFAASSLVQGDDLLPNDRSQLVAYLESLGCLKQGEAVP